MHYIGSVHSTHAALIVYLTKMQVFTLLSVCSPIAFEPIEFNLFLQKVVTDVIIFSLFCLLTSYVQKF